LKAPVKPKCRAYTGLAEYVDMFEEGEAPERQPVESKREKKEKEKKKRIEENLMKMEEDLKDYNPKELELNTNPFRTIFVCRISYETTDARLKKEFELYGPIKSIKIARDLQGKSRGYGFIEYENEEGYKNAYKHADGKRIDGRRIMVDYEQGRTTKGWKPRRLGGGKGNSRATRQKGEYVAKEDIETIYDINRGYKPVTSRSRSRSKKSERKPFNEKRNDRKYENRRNEGSKNR
jgi:U1 small nuclear ribonucleoprotein